MTTSSSNNNNNNNNDGSLDKDMNALLREYTESERQIAINNILGALKVNPIEVLQLPIDYTENDIKEQYKKLSLLVHPDRIIHNPDLKKSAERAFAKLAEAKQMISNIKYQNKLKVQILEAKRRIEARKHAVRVEEEIIGIPFSSSSSSSSTPSTSTPDKNNTIITSNTDIITPTPTTTTTTTTTNSDSSTSSDRLITGQKRSHNDMIESDINPSNIKKEEENDIHPSKKIKLVDSNPNSNSNAPNLNLNLNPNPNNDGKNGIEKTTTTTTTTVDNNNNNINNNINNNNNNVIITDEEIMKELKEMLIDEAWQEHIEVKAAERIEKQQNAYRDELREKLKAEKERQETWNEARDQRVDNWRTFQNNKLKNKSKKKKKSTD